MAEKMRARHVILIWAQWIEMVWALPPWNGLGNKWYHDFS